MVDSPLGKGTFQCLPDDRWNQYEEALTYHLEVLTVPDAVPVVHRQSVDVWQLCRSRLVDGVQPLDRQGKV